MKKKNLPKLNNVSLKTALSNKRRIIKEKKNAFCNVLYSIKPVNCDEFFKSASTAPTILENYMTIHNLFIKFSFIFLRKTN